MSITQHVLNLLQSEEVTNLAPEILNNLPINMINNCLKTSDFLNKLKNLIKEHVNLNHTGLKDVNDNNLKSVLNKSPLIVNNPIA